MKLNKIVVGLMVSSSLLGGIFVTTNINKPSVEAKSAKESNVITDKDVNGRKVKITVDTSKVAVFKSEGNKDMILVKVNVKNNSKKQIPAEPTLYTKATQNKDGVVSNLSATSPYSDELSNDWKTLADNKDKDLDKGASVDTVLAFFLENDKPVVFKASDTGKGKITIKNISKLPEIKTVSDSDSEE